MSAPEVLAAALAARSPAERTAFLRELLACAAGALSDPQHLGARTMTHAYAFRSPWSDLERSLSDLCPCASTDDVREQVQAARAASLDPAEFSGAVWGTQAAGRLGMPTGLTLIFGDWEGAEAFTTVRAGRVQRVTREALAAA